MPQKRFPEMRDDDEDLVATPVGAPGTGAAQDEARASDRALPSDSRTVTVVGEDTGSTMPAEGLRGRRQSVVDHVSDTSAGATRSIPQVAGAYIAPGVRGASRVPQENRLLGATDDISRALGAGRYQAKKVFEEVDGYGGFRYPGGGRKMQFDRWYGEVRVLVDEFAHDSDDFRMQAAAKSRAIETYNAGVTDAETIGYLAKVLGVPVPYDKAAAALRGEVVEYIGPEILVG